MKPNYCSGGSFVSRRFSNFSSSSSNNDVYNKNNELSVGSPSTPQQEQRNHHHVNEKMASSTPDYYSSAMGSPVSPFIVYRSAKYVTPHARAWQNLRNYAKYYVLVPVVLFANRCKDAFYLLFGFTLLVLTSPLWILLILGLLTARRLRLLLIKKFYPDLDQLDNCDSFSPSAESPGIVNSIIWTRGKVDATTIRQKFKSIFSENPQLFYLLKRKVGSRLGAQVWETCEDFSLENHIAETSRRIVDEPLKELYRTGSGSNKSILQKYVSHCVSMPMLESSPPWKIHVISYISREDGLREKTCLVIRMHVSLIKNVDVQQALKELFLNPSMAPESQDEEVSSGPVNGSECQIISQLEVNHEMKYVPLQKRFVQRIKKIRKTYQNSFTVWVNLRVKQLEFHSKTAVLSLILIDMKDSLRNSLISFDAFARLSIKTKLQQVKRILVNLQALAAIPMIIVGSFVRRDRLKRLGLQRTQASEKKRLISWSDLLYVDLVEEICDRGGGLSPENVVMMACSYALSDYYQMNNISIPRKIGFTVNSAYNSICSSKIRKAVQIPGNDKRAPSSSLIKLKSLEEKAQNYPEWKMLGLLYSSRYLNYILPNYLSEKVQRSIVSCYPFLLTHVNFTSDSMLSCGGGQDFLPIRQLYGKIVEDFVFWPLPPLSDLGVSITLVRYAGKMRLFVMSPFQSMDTILTHRCNQYLIRLAEDVGMERNRIPYSRRTSPSSTSCSTPQPLSIINAVDNLSMITSSKRSSNNACL